MRIGIYQEPSSGIGGSELVAAVMARALRDRGTVELVHHRPGFAATELEQAFGLDLDGIRFRCVPKPEGDPIHSGGSLLTAGRHWRRWNAAVSEPYDLFVASLHGVPPHCHAPVGVGYVHFPVVDRWQQWPWNFPPRRCPRGVTDRLRRWAYERGWRERVRSYQSWLANSAYTAGWVERRWGARPQVLYPPVRLESPGRPKYPSIVGLSRFTSHKQHADILHAFARFVSSNAPEWELVFVGALSDQPADRACLAALQKAAAGLPVRLVVNATRAEIRAELERAAVFCHGMGLGADDATEPWRVEHFGIATVEAMSAGCVAVVPDRGGQAEIVRHGESGYTCCNADEMGARVLGLIRDPVSRARMAVEAQLRARAFGIDRFTEQFLAEVDRAAGTPAPQDTPSRRLTTIAL